MGEGFELSIFIDEGVREALAIEVDTSLPTDRMIRVLDHLFGPLRKVREIVHD